MRVESMPCKKPNFVQSLAFPVPLTHACQEIVLSAEPHASPDHYWLWLKKHVDVKNNCLCMRSMRQIFHKENFDSPLIWIEALVYFHGIPLCCINTARELYSRTDIFFTFTSKIELCQRERYILNPSVGSLCYGNFYWSHPGVILQVGWCFL